MQKENAAVFRFCIFLSPACKLFLYELCRHKRILHVYRYAGCYLYILSTCNATYSYILISHIDINRLHVGINEIHFIDKFHIYNNLLYDKKIKLYVDLKSYMSTQIC